MIQRFPVMDDITKIVFLDPLSILGMIYDTEESEIVIHMSNGKEAVFRNVTLNDFEGYVNLVATAQRRAEQEGRK